jgi:hypothetical protein
MAFTIDQTVTRLRTSIGNPSTTLVTDAALFECVNDALRELFTKYRWQLAEKKATMATVIGTAAYTLPTDCEAVLMVRNLTSPGGRIYKGGSDQLAETLPTVSGRPKVYFRNQRTITLFPVPDAVYSLEIYHKLQYTALTTGQSLFTPDSWISAVVRLARAHYYDGYGADPAKSREAYNSFTMMVNDLPGEAEEEAQDTLLGVSLSVYEREAVTRLDFDHED